MLIYLDHVKDTQKNLKQDYKKSLKLHVAIPSTPSHLPLSTNKVSGLYDAHPVSKD